MNEINNSEVPFPLPPFLELLGLEVVEIGDDGRSVLRMPSHEKLWQPYGVLHGGSIYTLADSAAAYAIGGMVERTKRFVTIEMKINYLAPVKDGIVEARARVLKGGR